MQNMSGEEPASSVLELETMTSKACISDIQQKTDEEYRLFYIIENLKSGEFGKNDIEKYIEGIDKSDNNDIEKAIKAIVEIKYEELRNLYSKSEAKNYSIVQFENNIKFTKKLKCWMNDKLARCACHEIERTDEQTNCSRLSLASRVINLLTNCQLKVLYEFVKGKKIPHPKRDVFLWAVLTNKLSLARVLWEKIITSDHIASALTASLMLKSMASEIQKCDNPEMSEVHHDFTSEAEWYETQAKKILEECSRTDFSRAVALFLSASKNWGDKTLCELALSGKHVMFLDQECCRYALEITWNSPIKQIQEKYSEILKSQLIKEKIQTLKSQLSNTKIEEGETPEESFEATSVDETVEKEHNNTTNPNDAGQKQNSIICLCVNSVSDKFKYIYTHKLHSPLFKFILHFLSYVTFLVLFSYFLLFDVDKEKLSKYEILVWCWIISMCLEEIRQVFDSDEPNLWLKIASYLSSIWNVYDLVEFVLFLVALIMRLTVIRSQFYVVKMIYVVCLIMFILRMLQYLSVLEYFGPKIGILIRMFKHTIAYILMFGLFLIAYGIATQVLMYPNSNATSHVLFNIVYYPYFALFQQIDFIKNQFESCVYNDTLVSMQDGTPKCSWLADALSAVYIFVVCIMLINLLIATYSATYKSVEKNAKAVWLSYRIDFITEYIKKPMLPPPLNVFELIFMLCGKFQGHDDLKLTFELNMTRFEKSFCEIMVNKNGEETWAEKCYDNLMNLEKSCLVRVLKKQEDAYAMDHEFFDDFKKMKADIKDILQHLRGVENNHVNKNQFEMK